MKSLEVMKNNYESCHQKQVENLESKATANPSLNAYLG
jgi:hypothetical protein